jgi:hypothetical protein
MGGPTGLLIGGPTGLLIGGHADLAARADSIVPVIANPASVETMAAANTDPTNRGPNLCMFPPYLCPGQNLHRSSGRAGRFGWAT